MRYKVNLTRNQIQSVEWQTLPVEIEDINLNFNQIKEVGDLSRVSKLKKVSCYRNKIHIVHWNKLPNEIQYIHLSQNQISEVPDLEFLTKLTRLNLTENHITRVQSVKPYMEGKYVLWDNPITHAAKECFSTQELYICFKRSVGFGYTLRQPPQEVLYRGYAAVVEYFNHRLVSHCRHRYVMTNLTIDMIILAFTMW